MIGDFKGKPTIRPIDSSSFRPLLKRPITPDKPVKTKEHVVIEKHRDRKQTLKYEFPNIHNVLRRNQNV